MGFTWLSESLFEKVGCIIAIAADPLQEVLIAKEKKPAHQQPKETNTLSHK